MFLQEIKPDKKYLAKVYFDWHGKLTGSCLAGRNLFVQENNISMSRKYTLKEFCELTKNAYGSDIIRKIMNN